MYSFIFCFNTYKLSKQVVKSGKVPSLLLTRSSIKKTAIIVSIFGTSRIFTIMWTQCALISERLLYLKS